jgi:hypothetical protein
MSSRFKQRYHKLKRQGVCVICAEAKANVGVRCEACAEEHSRQQTRRDNAKFYRSRIKRAAHTIERIETLWELGRKITALQRQMTWGKSA